MLRRAGPACVSAQAKRAPARRDGHAGLRQPLPRGAGGRRRSSTATTAAAFGLREGDVVVSIHCGSRGLGHQIGTEFLKRMAVAAPQHGISAARPRARLRADRLAARPGLPRRDARGDQLRAGQPPDPHAPGARGLRRGAAAGAAAAALRRVAQHLQARGAHASTGKPRRLYVHRKGATRAFGPGHPDLPEPLRAVGQPVLIGGSHGHRLLRAGRHARGRGALLQLRLPRRRPRDEPPPGHAASGRAAR